MCFFPFTHWTFEGYIFLYFIGRLGTKPSVWLNLSSDCISTTLVCLSKWARHKSAVACRFAWLFKMVGFHYTCFVYNSDEKWSFQLQAAGLAQGLGKLGLGLRPHFQWLKVQIFIKLYIYIYIFIYLKVMHFFLSVMLKIL